MLFGIVSWIIASLFVLTVSYLLYRQIRTNSYALNALSITFLTIFVTTLFTLIMGLCGFLRPGFLAFISLACLLPIGMSPSLRRELSGVLDDVRSAKANFKNWWKGLPIWLRWFTAVALTVSIIRFTFLILVFPPFVWDSLTYHLTNVAHWTQQGRIELFETSMSRIYTPANYEVLATWFTVFLHQDIVIEAAGIPVYILAVLAVYATCRGLGYSTSSSWIGALAYGSTPALLLATTGTKNDPHIAAYFLAALAIIIDLYGRKDKSHDRNVLGQIIILVLMILLAAGTKAYIAHLLPGLILIGLLGAWRLRGKGIWGRILGQAISQLQRSGSWKRFFLLVLILTGLFVGSYWNIRNWILTGNPFYPYGVTIERAEIWGSTQGQGTAHLSTDRLVGNLKSLVYKFGDRRAPIMPDLTDTTGWGWFAYGLGLPAFLWAFLRKPKIRILILGFIASLFVLFLSDRPSPWNMRYVIWFPAIFALAFVAMCECSSKWSAVIRRTFIGLIVFAMGMNIAITINYGRIPLGQFSRMLRLPALERDAAKLHITVPKVYEEALEVVPKSEVLGYNVHGNGFIYPLYRADFSQKLTYIPFPDGGSCEDILDEMRIRGTSWLFVGSASEEDKALAQECAEVGVLDEVGEMIYEFSSE